jgi:hypothetical protein
MPVQEIVLVIKYRCDSARCLTRIKDLGTLVEVREDGVSRKPKSADTSTALRWLADNGYEPVNHTWLDRPGGIYRRRKSTFKRNGKGVRDAHIRPNGR